MRLLVAEDERNLAEVLCALLERDHYSVTTVHDGKAALDALLAETYDGAVLDVMMPAMDGMEVLRRARHDGVTAPIMMLTAKGERSDRIAGFDAGADDYLPKPFAPDEFLSRVRAMVRRRDSWRPVALTLGNTTLDTGGSILRVGDATDELPRREFQIMEVLMGAPSRIHPAEEILERVWGWEDLPETNVLWVHLSNLRKKLKALGSDLAIRSVRGLGYRIEETKADPEVRP